jgi:ABC-type ATPase involved in cell division
MFAADGSDPAAKPLVLPLGDSALLVRFGSTLSEPANVAALKFARLLALRRVRRRVAYVFQNAALFDSMSVFENVAFPLPDRTDWSDEIIRRVTMPHLGMVGMREHARHTPDQLSAGMAKRVALSRALALDPRIVIIDDFDSGIDGVRLALLTELIQDVQNRTGATFLVTTHDTHCTLIEPRRVRARAPFVGSDGSTSRFGPATRRPGGDAGAGQRRGNIARRGAIERSMGSEQRSRRG